MFWVQPSQFNSAPPRGNISSNNIILKVQGTNLNQEQVSKGLMQTLDEFEMYLSWLRKDAETLEETLRRNTKAAITARQLERLFKDETGQSPQNVYLRLRLKHARWMMKGEMTLASIAAETGFVDGSHLSKAFKAVFGTNPSQDRLNSSRTPFALEPNAEGRRVYDHA
jgi:transcriptional regulator GlxA family with amidase domain